MILVSIESICAASYYCSVVTWH